METDMTPYLRAATRGGVGGGGGERAAFDPCCKGVRAQARASAQARLPAYICASVDSSSYS